MSQLPRLVVVLGPTASGKSSLAIWLAEKLGGEVLICDSTQVYRRFDIGTGKVPLAEQRGIPHHLLDLVEPDELFTAGEYRRPRADCSGRFTCARENSRAHRRHRLVFARAPRRPRGFSGALRRTPRPHAPHGRKTRREAATQNSREARRPKPRAASSLPTRRKLSAPSSCACLPKAGRRDPSRWPRSTRRLRHYKNRPRASSPRSLCPAFTSGLTQ